MATAPMVPRAPGDDDRRGPYLDIARELAGNTGAGPSHHLAVSHVTLAAVAERAGVTRSALYRVWPSQQDFWSDLAEYLLVSDGEPDDSIAVGRSAGTDVDVVQDVLLTDPVPLLRAALVAYPGTSSTRRLVSAQRRSVLARLEGQIALELAASDRRCVDGLTSADLATAMTIVGNGLPITGRMAHAHDLAFDAPAFVPGNDGARSLLGVVFDSITRHLTTLHDDDSHEHDSLVRASVSAPSSRPHELDRWSESQRHYLSLGLELAVAPAERGLQHRVLGHVTLDAVARHAGVTRRTLTSLWPAQSQFRLDLFSHLLDRDRSMIEATIGEVATSINGRSLDQDAFRLLGDCLQQRVVAATPEVTHLAFAPQLDDSPLAELAIDQSDRHIASCGHALRGLLRAGQRRLRPGVTLRHAALALLTVVDGSSRLSRTDPALVRGTVTTSYGVHSLTGLVVGAVLSGLTEPVVRRSRAVQFAAMVG